MPRKHHPTGRSRGRPPGTYTTLHEPSERLTLRLPCSLATRLQAYAEQAHVWDSAPDVSRVARELLELALQRVHNIRQTENCAQNTLATYMRRDNYRQTEIVPQEDSENTGDGVEYNSCQTEIQSVDLHILCQTENIALAPLEDVILRQTENVPEGCGLGTLCKAGHGWQNTEQSLRRVRKNGSLGDCVMCSRERARRQGKNDALT